MGLNDFLKKLLAFALVVITIFFAYDIYTGKLFVADADGRMNVIAVLSAWIISYLGKLMTLLIVLTTGFVIAFFLSKGKKPAGPF